MERVSGKRKMGCGGVGFYIHVTATLREAQVDLSLFSKGGMTWMCELLVKD